jgi:hypothetical protein
MGNRTSNTSHRFGARKITGGGQTSRKRGPRAGSTIVGVGGQITLNPNLFDGKQGHGPHAADRRTPQPECPRRDIRLDPRRREGTTCAADVLSPGTCYSRSSNIAVRAWGFCRAQASPADPNWFNINGLASSTTSAYRDMAGGAMRLSAIQFPGQAPLPPAAGRAPDGSRGRMSATAICPTATPSITTGTDCPALKTRGLP